MINLESEFFKYSKEIAERFLQSTVVIDDKAGFPGPGEDSVAGKMKTPMKRPKVGGPADEEESEGHTAGTVGRTISEDPRQLDAKKVIDGFAAKGIVCSVIKPYEADRDVLSEYMYQLASNADVIVIDWVMQNDDGELALSLMEQIISRDLSGRAQLRLIAVYTIDRDLERIPEKIKVFLEGSGIPGISLTEEDRFTLRIGPIRIVVLSKPGTKIPKEALKQQVSFEGLANRLTTEFTDMTTGLISNVVIDSLAELRTNCHKIITTFSTDLDAPYLTHRTSSQNPEDAEDDLVALIGAELSTLLEEREVKNRANIRAIKYWIESKKPGINTFAFVDENGSPHYWTKENVIQLLERGISKIARSDYVGLSSTGQKNPHTTKLSKMYHCDDASSANLDERFAELFTLKSFYGKPNPTLNLGTIIKDTQENLYYICIQPRCDCVRIIGETDFIFLQLTIQTGSGKFNIVLKDNGNYVRLSIGKKNNSIKLSNSIKLIKFPANTEGRDVIIASEDARSYYFKDTEGNRYKWIGELRGDHALRLSNEFSSRLSRVGLIESEWLRGHAK